MLTKKTTSATKTVAKKSAPKKTQEKKHTTTPHKKASVSTPSATEEMVVKPVMGFVQTAEKKLEEIFKQAPRMGEKWQMLFVENLHWLIGVVVILSILVVIPTLWMLGLLFKGFFSFKMILPILIGLPIMLINLYLCITAYTPVKDRKKLGWNKMFYMELLWVAYTVISIFTTSASGFVSSLIGIVLCFYILFEIKKHYK